MVTELKDVVFYNGLKMPIVGFGTWQATPEEIEISLDAALKAGYRHIDTAFVYNNEDAIGRVLKRWFDSGKIQRKDLFIVTKKVNHKLVFIVKLPGTGNHAESVEKYIKLSLSALQLDYVDLYLIHSAVGKKDFDRSQAGSDHQAELDMNTDHVSLWKAMEAQVDAGRAKAIGLSNFNSRQIKRIWSSARIKPANLSGGAERVLPTEGADGVLQGPRHHDLRLRSSRQSRLCQEDLRKI
uniref:NADP-dependent oxidoreductase domain-containing protein n=1 Tax=Timema genevievae TaxID=629358 RepID=A0A7R9PQB7_TIMGE|nr:unnamed protein product [Timema genevievae]